MPNPNLIHPVAIKIIQWNSSDTMYDDEAREPIKQVITYPEITVSGQVSWTVKDQVTLELNGIKLSSRGYILFRHSDLLAQDITLKSEDKITKIGWRTVCLFIISLTDAAHYSDRNGATLLKAYFSDREPSRGN
jgi:hypothetical protein